MKQNNIESVLKAHPIIPVVTVDNVKDVDKLVVELRKQNVYCAEITMRTKAAAEAISYMKEKYGNEFSVGMGTVTLPKHVKEAKKMKVDFMVSPGLCPDLAEAFKSSEIAYIPGVATPSDIINAINLDIHILKFFPANLFGGLNALKTYGQVFPNVKFCPTGGINALNFRDYLDLKNVIAVGGSWVLGK
jgi:2-dehydro-3-deoxyphosphogluconate aldolase / (4S)-4-hydroxy-2-oxoglutarate aldolase